MILNNARQSGRKLTGATLIALICFAGQLATASVQMNVVSESKNVPAKSDGKVPDEVKEQMVVTLGKDYIEIDMRSEKRIYDFKARRRFALDPKTMSYDDYSLFDVVGFRDLEFENRKRLTAVMGAAKVDAGMTGLVEEEHALSIQKGEPRIVTVKEVGDDIEYAIEDHVMARCSKAGTTVSPDEAVRFTDFVRYYLGGHPQLLKKLAESNRIPNRLTLTFKQFWGTSTRTFEFGSVRHSDDSPYVITGYTKRTSTSSPDKLEKILYQGRQLSEADLTSKKSAIIALQKSDVQNGRLLDAMLGMLEVNLMSDQSVILFTEDQLKKVRSDAAIQQFSGAVAPKKNEAIPEALKTLENLQADAVSKAYVLKIFEANERGQLGQFNSAQNLIAEVLQANPYIAGVYKDLGDIYYRQFDTQHAWTCWDIGRRLAPQMSTLVTVTQYEGKLVAQYPEYF